MRLADVEPGTIVRFGRPKDLQFPRTDNFYGGRIAASCPALVVAVGRFTLTASGHCGETMPAVLDKGRTSVLILRQQNQNPYGRRGSAPRYDEITDKTTWQWDVVSPTHLMSLEEWDLKTFPLFELQIEAQVWQEGFDRLKRGVNTAATEKLTKKLASITGAVHAGITFQKFTDQEGDVRLAVNFDLSEEQLRKLIGTKRVTELIEYAKTKPDRCNL